MAIAKCITELIPSILEISQLIQILYWPSCQQPPTSHQHCQVNGFLQEIEGGSQTQDLVRKVWTHKDRKLRLVQQGGVLFHFHWSNFCPCSHEQHLPKAIFIDGSTSCCWIGRARFFLSQLIFCLALGLCFA